MRKSINVAYGEVKGLLTWLHLEKGKKENMNLEFADYMHSGVTKPIQRFLSLSIILTAAFFLTCDIFSPTFMLTLYPKHR